MLNKKEYRTLLTKFLNREADVLELDKLEDSIKDRANLSSFRSFVQTQFLIVRHMNEFNLDEAKVAIAAKVKSKRKKQRIKKVGRVSFVLAFVGVMSFLGWQSVRENHTAENTIVETGTDKAILTLENGNQLVLDAQREFRNDKLSSDGESLTYSQEVTETPEDNRTDFHILKTPRGGKFFVTLSDGTRVWLNSDSKIQYPVQFQKGKEREVHLLYGEAYFEVSPSTKHNGAGFHVMTRQQRINVLGTKFNVRAYSVDKKIATTLVEGSVEVDKRGKKRLLKPNDQSIVYDDAEVITVNQVDAKRKISWVRNQFVFDEATLSEVMDELARWYDVTIVFESGSKKQMQFTAILERSQGLEEVLALIAATSTQEQLQFEINNEMVIVK